MSGSDGNSTKSSGRPVGITDTQEGLSVTASQPEKLMGGSKLSGKTAETSDIGRGMLGMGSPVGRPGMGTGGTGREGSGGKGIPGMEISGRSVGSGTAGSDTPGIPGIETGSSVGMGTAGRETGSSGMPGIETGGSGGSVGIGTTGREIGSSGIPGIETGEAEGLLESVAGGVKPTVLEYQVLKWVEVEARSESVSQAEKSTVPEC